MGSGIGTVGAAKAGLQVTFVDPSEQALKLCETNIIKWCDKEINKERMSDEKKVVILSNIKFGDTLQHLNSSDFIIEAASEDFNLKKKLFQHMATVASENAILASNTSSISITKIAGCIPDRAH